MEQHCLYMLRAIEEAYAGMESGAGGPFGAVIVSPEGEIVAVAHNEVLGTQDCTQHAEIAVLRKTGRLHLQGYTMYATGFPCPMCLGALLWSRISTVYYCNDYERTKAIGFDDMAFLQTMGKFFFSEAPTLPKEGRVGDLEVRALPLPEGEELYAAWQALATKQHY